MSTAVSVAGQVTSTHVLNNGVGVAPLLITNMRTCMWHGRKLIGSAGVPVNWAHLEAVHKCVEEGGTEI